MGQGEFAVAGGFALGATGSHPVMEICHLDGRGGNQSGMKIAEDDQFGRPRVLLVGAAFFQHAVIHVLFSENPDYGPGIGFVPIANQPNTPSQSRMQGRG